MPGKGWFTLLRLYSLLEPFFTKGMVSERNRTHPLNVESGAGNSDLAWQMLGAVEYTFRNSVSAAIGYRYLGQV